MLEELGLRINPAHLNLSFARVSAAISLLIWSVGWMGGLVGAGGKGVNTKPSPVIFN